jgi:methyltransferase
MTPLFGTPLFWVLLLVIAQRLAELFWAERNTKALKARGAREIDAAHYPLFILLHASWALAIALSSPWARAPNWALIALFVLLQLARIWVIATLGPYWTTRIITLDEAPLVRRGPYRFVRHPNYWIVAGEIAVLPLAFGEWQVAVIWSVLNALLLHQRIGVEERALEARSHANENAAAPIRRGGVLN